MRFQRNIKMEYGLGHLTLTPLLNVIFLLFGFFMFTSSLTAPNGIKVRVPKAVTSDIIQEDNFVVTINAEDIIYFKNSVYTIKDLREELRKPGNQQRAVLIKADRHASMGRIVDVWDLCRQLKVERIHLATNH